MKIKSCQGVISLYSQIAWKGFQKQTAAVSTKYENSVWENCNSSLKHVTICRLIKLPTFRNIAVHSHSVRYSHYLNLKMKALRSLETSMARRNIRKNSESSVPPLREPHIWHWRSYKHKILRVSFNRNGCNNSFTTAISDYSTPSWKLHDRHRKTVYTHEQQNVTCSD